MRYPLYIPEVVSPEGETILTISDAISLQAARAFNTAGSATLVLPNYYDPDIFQMHTRFKLWRYDYQGKPRLFGDTIWFLKKIDHAISDFQYTFTLVDSFSMLGTRIVAYTAQTTYADKTLEEFELITYNDDLRIDNMMRAYMRENFGDEALNTERTNPNITIEQDRSVGPYGEKQASWQELDGVLSDLARQASANGATIFYDLIPNEDGTFNFRIWDRFRGVNMGSTSPNPLVLSDDSGLLAEVHEVIDWSNVATVCYALGFDSGASQVIREVALPSLVRNDPFGRIEMTVNASDSDVNSVLDAAAQEALNGRKARRSVTAKVVENQSLVYGEHLSYGDQLAIQIASRKYDVVVNAVSVTWDSKGEVLDIRLSGEEAVPNVTTPYVPTPGIPTPGEINTAPVVDAGDNQEIALAETADLVGSAVDDGLPNPPAALTYEWTKQSGPGDVTFGDATDPTTTADFSESGTYVLRLSASDSELSDSDEITISVGVEPPSNGLLDGTELVAVLALDGNFYITSDFQTPSGSGGPTWTLQSTGISETPYTWVVDPFSPGYLNHDGTGSIDGWIVTETDIYRVEDIFGTISVVSAHTFSTPTTAASFHWRTIQASFGAYFPLESGDNPWLACISYYGDTSGHEGTWATYSIDAGVTWSAEVQLEDDYTENPDRFWPMGLYLSPKTPQLGYTVVRGGDLTDGMPYWLLWDSDANTYTRIGFAASYTYQESVGPGNFNVNRRINICPPIDTKRLVVQWSWSATRVDAGSGSAGFVLQTGSQSELDVTDGENFVDSSLPVGSVGGSHTTVWEKKLAAIGLDWEGNTTEILTEPLGWASGAHAWARHRIQLLTSTTGNTLDVEISSRVVEIELEDGTIYTFGPGPTQAKVTNDWGASWSNTAFLDAGSAMAGTIHLPWPNNDEEEIAYHGYYDTEDQVRNFRLKRVSGGVPTDISPNDGSRNYGVNRGHFAARTYDSNRQYVVVGVMGNDTSDDPADDMHAVYISSNNGDSWVNVVTPIADSAVPAGRPGFEAAFAGDTEQVLYIWGPTDYLGYSDDFGATVDDRTGDLPGGIGIIGIAGGPLPD